MMRLFSFGSPGLWSIVICSFFDPKLELKMALESPTLAQKTLDGVTSMMTAQDPDLSLTVPKFLFMNSTSPARHPCLKAVSKSFGNSG